VSIQEEHVPLILSITMKGHLNRRFLWQHFWQWNFNRRRRKHTTNRKQFNRNGIF